MAPVHPQAFRTGHFEMLLAPSGQWWVLRWNGSPSEQEVHDTLAQALMTLAANPTPAVIYNERRLVGDYSHFREWIFQDVLPGAMSLGLRYVAFVLPFETSTQAVTEQIVRSIPPEFPLQVQMLEDEAAAEAWLHECL